MSQGCGSCGSFRDSLEALRSDLDARHDENRRAIEKLEAEQDKTARELAELSGRIKPYLDNGQPGLFSKMNDKLDDVLDKMQQMFVDQAADRGARNTVRFGLQHIIGPLLVGIALVIAQHFWK